MKSPQLSSALSSLSSSGLTHPLLQASLCSLMLNPWLMSCSPLATPSPSPPPLPPAQTQPEDLRVATRKNLAHECEICLKQYSTASNLARHRQTHRSLCDKDAKSCQICGKKYVSQAAFAMHLRTHDQGCRCVFCGRTFSRPWLLQGHMRTHTGEKPFGCEICGKFFADKSNLRAHVQTHSKVKPFECNKCGKAFALKSYLYKHQEASCRRRSTKGVNKGCKNNNNECLKNNNNNANNADNSKNIGCINGNCTEIEMGINIARERC